jgi:hypothetical protein
MKGNISKKRINAITLGQTFNGNIMHGAKIRHPRSRPS